jgi:hypothetical protein
VPALRKGTHEGCPYHFPYVRTVVAADDWIA